MPFNDENTAGLLPPPENTSKSRWDYLFPLLSRLLVWGLFFGLLTLLNSFFTLIFLTFVFAYLQNSVVNMLSRRVHWLRPILVFITGGVALSLIIGISIFITPKVYDQATGFVRGFFTYMEKVDQEILNFASRYPVLQEAIPELHKMLEPPPIAPEPTIADWANPLPPPTTPTQPVPPRAFKDSPTGLLISTLTGGGKTEDTHTMVKVALDHFANIGRQALGLFSTFLLALLFSFLIVLDLPRLARSVKELRNTRLRFIYDEVAENIYEFGKVLGNAMQAQFYIACVNTLLTGISLTFLGMGNQVAFLSVIVFICSFIPVAGVFISSIPICLIALSVGGLHLVLLSIVMIVVVHMIEGYILNPLIYGARLRINPVIVLIILTVGGKLFHIWGLILGVPVCTYIFGYAIRYKKPNNTGFLNRTIDSDATVASK